MQSDSHKTILIAGASGYIGRALIPEFLKNFPNSKIIALSRSQQTSEDQRVVWHKCDLFSRRSLEAALPEKIDLAVYLVHSMSPTAKLDQGGFEDYDLILADNFARVLSGVTTNQVIYLGGLIPENTPISLHLKSRTEVESVFKSFDLPLTIFRAGLILGESGSSFQILLKLINRIPIMICPSWTQTLTSPVDLETVLKSFCFSAFNKEHIRKTLDLSGCRALTYLEMMQLTAKRMKKKRLFFKVPFFTPTLSRLWVKLITGSSKNLVYPLVESLKHPMIARKNFLHPKSQVDQKYYELLDNVSFKTKKASFNIFKFKTAAKSVRSVQRLVLPKGKNAAWVMEKYIDWLPKFLRPFIKVILEENHVYFCLFKRSWVFLGLRKSTSRSDPSRQLLYITSGALVSKKNKGRLEFREVLDKKYIIAAIHDYQPSLPWFFYIFTQARLHLWVMKSFNRHLHRYDKYK